MSVVGIAETLMTLLSAGYAAHRIEQAALARKGYNTRDFWKPVERWTHCATCLWPQHCAEADCCDPRPASPLAQERREAQLFIDVSSAFWMDPNRWGDDPDWRKRLFPEPKGRGQIDHLKEQLADAAYAIYNPKATMRIVSDTDKPDYRHGACPTCGAPCEQFVFHSHEYYSCTRRGCDLYEQAWGTQGRQLVLDAKAHWVEKPDDSDDAD